VAQHARVGAALHGRVVVRRADYQTGRAAAHHGDVDDEHAEATEAREVDLGEPGPGVGKVLVVLDREGDVAVLHQIDHHGPGCVVGFGRYEHGLADLEEGRRHTSSSADPSSSAVRNAPQPGGVAPAG
jgi:hypothetical protein